MQMHVTISISKAEYITYRYKQNGPNCATYGNTDDRSSSPETNYMVMHKSVSPTQR